MFNELNTIKQEEFLHILHENREYNSLNIEPGIFTNVDFSNKLFIGCCFSHSKFFRCTFTRSFFRMCFLEFCEFENCNFEHSNIQFSSFGGSVFTNTGFQHSDILHTSFNGITADNINFNDSDLYNSTIANAHLLFTKIENCNVKKLLLYKNTHNSVSFKSSNVKDTLEFETCKIV